MIGLKYCLRSTEQPPGSGLKSDYDRIEILMLLCPLFVFRFLKSDYDRIEIIETVYLK